MRSLMGLRKRRRLRSTNPRSLDEFTQLRTHTTHYSPVMIAPLQTRPERSFFSGGLYSALRLASADALDFR
jgi:hypothetical protein